MLRKEQFVDLINGHFIFCIIRNLIFNVVRRHRRRNPYIDNDGLLILLSSETCWGKRLRGVEETPAETGRPKTGIITSSRILIREILKHPANIFFMSFFSKAMEHQLEKKYRRCFKIFFENVNIKWGRLLWDKLLRWIRMEHPFEFRDF